MGVRSLVECGFGYEGYGYGFEGENENENANAWSEGGWMAIVRKYWHQRWRGADRRLARAEVLRWVWAPQEMHAVVKTYGDVPLVEVFAWWITWMVSQVACGSRRYPA